MLFDSTLSYRGSASGKTDTEDSTHPLMSPTDCQVLIRKGELLCGMLDKKALGDSGGGLIHIIFNEDGFQAAANFISVVQFVVNNWMAHHGFSCGIGDTVADPATMSKISVIIQEAKGSVQEIIKAYQGGQLEERPGRCALFLELCLCLLSFGGCCHSVVELEAHVCCSPDSTSSTGITPVVSQGIYERIRLSVSAKTLCDWLKNESVFCRLQGS